MLQEQLRMAASGGNAKVMTKQFEIRLARPEELPYAFAIDEASVPLFAAVGLRMSFADRVLRT